MFQEQGTVVISMDALFGLPCKRTSGTSYRPPLYGSVYFLQHDEVNSFVKHHINPSVNNVTDDFFVEFYFLIGM